MRAPPNPGQLRGSGGGQGGASPLVTLRLFQTMSTHPLCDAFGYHNFDDTGGLGYFLILERDILLLLDLASTQVLVKTIHKLRHSVKFTL